MARPKLANSSSITSASPSASCLTPGGRAAIEKVGLKSDDTRLSMFTLDRRCRLRSGCGRSQSALEFHRFLQSGHRRRGSNFAFCSPPNLESGHTRETIGFCQWLSVLQPEADIGLPEMLTPDLTVTPAACPSAIGGDEEDSFTRTRPVFDAHKRQVTGNSAVPVFSHPGFTWLAPARKGRPDCGQVLLHGTWPSRRSWPA